ncbi:hydrolase [Liquorilactobacillus sucicola DSM 21376 = JCM 15457]|uniref:HAD superfamily hydrolase n=1 Tax=Liquorilactobacillus sucicola DSM 21376 = JCM 15457 TaxID=1423806 RepID=A0A023CYY8_9LACO|nr:Cof-type HAD-IIB family hydrolase [Liquorilactobacillus sucicola]KRN07583.1 HAD superfamily hydrolase [Liquorilactobacillus sucicola DSM 21376 = JCM 15457]GAJ26786.1 hydrolase [Liquorilactobacillus sucicola DSM 21376 = JCM 15457]
MYKMVTCDLDETLLSDDKGITAENIQAIQAAAAKGVHFVPNTGRNYLTVQDNLRELGLFQKKNEYVISFNGGAIVENKNNRFLRVNTMKFETIRQLFKLGVAHNFCVHVYSLHELYIWNMNQSEVDYLTGRINGWIDLKEDEIDKLQDKELVKILFYVPAAEERLELRKFVEQNISQDLNITFSSDRYIEFNDPSADKGSATLQLGQQLGIRPAEIIAIGDNSNDLPMIEKVGMGVCVSNGKDFVKKKAAYITRKDNNHSAVAEVIEKFIL